MPRERRAPPPDLWQRPDMAPALAGKDIGAIFRIYRRWTGSTQQDLAELIGGIAQPRISAIERGREQVMSLDLIQRIASGLNIPGHLLGLAPETMDDSASAIHDEDVQRREFHQLAVGVLAGAALDWPDAAWSVPTPPPDAVDAPARIGTADVAMYRRHLGYLYELDNTYGGGAAYRLTVAAVNQMRRALQTSSHTPDVGDALTRVLGEATEHAGWLAHDAGREQDARYWWLEALHAAQTADDDDVSTVAFASMSLAASTVGTPRDVVNLARAAQRCAATRNTPRLRSLLLAREAVGRAAQREPKAAWSALAKADNLIGTESDADPYWLEFWGQADLACHRMKAAEILGDIDTAVTAAGEAVTAVDPRFARNHAAYLASHGRVLATAGRPDEAMEVTGQAILRTAGVDSARIRSHIGQAVNILEARDASSTVRGFVEWARAYPLAGATT
ncbi:helix-turn-helix domain-containing protein [Protofrankia symbiont of Coriaria ruscifolia]|uniref:HTH cro/C1-type domain-containing protein n=1 Tax=Candidatus Protofrankia californiensis TaxID=1839754 RepID=A0A1C3NWV3_9ACTN|nr:helix-turn-helix transcriptional regulator [Protofrankia symbiont of Coriaria ruscifolia]SBW21600.1 hypothetical protein FDG2_2054 [Candidatus Protofrankia californiensis]